MTDAKTMTDTINAYVAAFAAGDADAAAALFAEDASVEDPIGSPVRKGRGAIRAFYAQSMVTGAKLTLEGPVRIAGDIAAFPFSVNLTLNGSAKRIDVIDIFRFDGSGKIIEMRAFWGPDNMHGF